jgi:hypothetical protein
MIERRSGRERARRLGSAPRRNRDREISMLCGVTATVTLKPDHFIMYSLSGALMVTKKEFM